MNHLSRFLIPFLSAGALAASASNDDENPVQLGEITVLADRAFPLTVPPIEAARYELRLVPGGVETIDPGRFLRGRSSTLADTFSLSPGVVAQSRFGSDEARLSIRGSGLQRTFHGRGIRLLQDGVPLNLADGGFDMQSIEPLSVAYINVWRGANALAAGASTLGGAIDYVTLTGRDAPPAFARVEFGSWDYQRTSISAGAALGALDFYASATRHSQRSFRDHAAQRNFRVFANAGIRHSMDAETRVYVTGIRTDSELPGSLSKSQLQSRPSQAAAASVALDQKRDFELLRIASRTSLRSGPTLWDLTLAWTYKDLDHPIFQVIDQLSNDALVSITATHNGQFFGHTNRLRGGVFLNRGVTNAANLANGGGRRGALLSAAEQTAKNLEAFLDNQFALTPELTLAAGANASSNRRRNDQRLGTVPDYDLTYNRVMPKLGLRWERAGVQFFANVSASYEPPSFSESLTLGAPRDSQTATTFEVGSRGRRGPVSWDATLYHAALRKELLSLDHDNNPSTPASTVNAHRTTHSGVELAGEIDLLGNSWDGVSIPANRLVLRTAWTYGRFRFDDDPRYGDNLLAGLPPHLVRAELTWESADGWYAGPTLEWVPQKTFIDFRNTFSADPHALAGFRVGRRGEGRISWFAEIRNAFDERHAATTGVIENARGHDQSQFLPGDGRGIFAGADFAW